MPLQDDMHLISVDDHVIEHPNVWLDRLPARLRDAGPRLLEVELDSIDAYGIARRGLAEVWVYEGRQYPRPTLDAVAGRSRDVYTTEPYRFEDVIPGCWDPVARVADMDLDGIQAQLCFPTFPRFAGTAFIESTDRELGRLSVQAYNDFMIDEWCAAAPDRFIPLVILPLWDADACVAEIERTAAKGARAISFPENLPPLGLPSWHTGHWDAVLAAAQDAELPLCMHFGTSGTTPRPAPESSFATTIALMGTNSMATLADLLFSHVFHTFDRLKVVLSEGGIGWIPYLLERADYTWERHRGYTGVNQDVAPSELFRRNVWGCYIEDDAGLAARDRIGVDRIMWECDYPHSDCNWPHARKLAVEALADVPDDDARRIVELNAREVFRFPRRAAAGG